MLTREVFARVEEHLKAIPLKPCWVCGNPSWEAQTIIWPQAVPHGDPPPPIPVHNTQRAPMVVVACTNCFNTLHFMWIPIRDKKKAPERIPSEGT